MARMIGEPAGEATGSAHHWGSGALVCHGADGPVGRPALSPVHFDHPAIGFLFRHTTGFSQRQLCRSVNISGSASFSEALLRTRFSGSAWFEGPASEETGPQVNHWPVRACRGDLMPTV